MIEIIDVLPSEKIRQFKKSIWNGNEWDARTFYELKQQHNLIL